MKHFQDLCGIEIYIDGELCLWFLFDLVLQLLCHYGSWKVNFFSYISVATLETKVCKVQKTIDALIDNGIHGQPMKNSHDKPYKTFFDVIEGKEARFHEYIYIY